MRNQKQINRKLSKDTLTEPHTLHCCDCSRRIPGCAESTFAGLAATVGLLPKDLDGEFSVTQVQWTTMPFVWLVAVRKNVCLKNDLPETTVLLKLLPEAECKCEFPILRLSSPLSVVIRNSSSYVHHQCHHHHSCFRLSSSLSFVIRNILPLAHGSN